jgi:putative pyruvate formate lyase activating enzyme
VAAYVRTHQTRALAHKAKQARDLLNPCRLCPRQCGANRLNGATGVCRIGRLARVSSTFPHHGEEDCLRGRRGSGTIFFAGCNLHCVFCQNYDLSHLNAGHEVTAAELAGLMLELQSAGCHNVNFVTPSHVVPQILEALVIAVEHGLRIPLVYNTGGYDRPEVIGLLDGVFDVYLPDFKLWTADSAARYLTARDYPDVARQALQAMHAQVGALRVDEDGLALRGVVLRHLVMPGLPDETREILRWIATALSPDTHVNLMDQYHPVGHVGSDPQFRPINRRLRSEELEAAYAAAREAGLWRFDT